jgi:DNA gyrase subunit A
MPRRENSKGKKTGRSKAEIKGAGLVLEQPITQTLETNYMPYAMSVIVSRAIPEIDGFKPSHRKLLYTMYKMGLLTGARTKSANVVGQTMHLNPHGDTAIYETMVRLSKGNEALLHPYVDSKGNFGKAYSRDMTYAASRYTEVKLDAICTELFRDIDKDTVDFMDNYDSTTKEPTLLPVAFPSILVNANTGIAVGMASSICPFNLAEVCETAMKMMKHPDADILSTIHAPDFPGGGQILYDKTALETICETGRGSLRVRSKYDFDKSGNCIEITEIPPTTTVEAIIDKIIELVKLGRIREISDIRDETDLSGLKLTIDLKRGTDADRLMAKLFKMTPLEDSFSCNFNVLVGSRPRVMGVRELLSEWTAFRTECVRRRLFFELNRYREKLHLLIGLAKILLDIDKAIRIVRESEAEAEVIPNLMIGFGIDEKQAEYVAEIRLRHLNREYILQRTQETEKLEEEIAHIEATLSDRDKILELMASELREIAKKYGRPRKSLIIYDNLKDIADEPEKIEDYPVTLFMTRDGYFKKITPQSLRMSGEHKLKEGDTIVRTLEASNACDLLFFTNLCQVYKTRVSDFDDTKASVLGEYIPAKLGFDEGESVLFMGVTNDYKGYMLFFFANGKAAKIELEAYTTKLNRKKLIGAFSDKSPLAAAVQVREDCEFLLISTAGRMLIIHSGAIAAKTTRNTQGIAVMTLKPGHSVARAVPYADGRFKNPHRYRVRNLPAAGMLPSPEDTAGEQLNMY